MDNYVGVDGDGINDEFEKEGNVISGNNWYNIYISDANSNNNKVSGNIIGLDASGENKITGNGTGVVVYNGANYSVVGNDNNGISDDKEGNIISANNLGVQIGAIASSATTAPSPTQYNRVAGNYIGLNKNGDKAIGNNGTGIQVNNGKIGDSAVKYNVIEGNVISGNAGLGIYFLYSTSYNRVTNNIIGLNAEGTAALPNSTAGGCGVAIYTDSNHNIFDKNTISGNLGYPICMEYDAHHNRISGNYIGLDPSGSHAMPNGAGIYMVVGNVNNNVIGTDIDNKIDGKGDGNVISGNNGTAIWLRSANENTIAGNYIGTDALGTTPIPNKYAGVYLECYTAPCSQNNKVEGNVIGSSSLSAGVVVNSATSSGNIIRNNYIGTDGSEKINLGNATNGIEINSGAASTTVEGNHIRFNGKYGIKVTSNGIGNKLTKNSVYDNAAPQQISIDVKQAPTPIKIEASQGQDPCKIEVIIPQIASGNSVEVYNGQDGGAKTYLGNATYGTDSYLFETMLPEFGTTLNALAIDTNGNTSQLSDLPYKVSTVCVGMGTGGGSPIVTEGDDVNSYNYTINLSSKPRSDVVIDINYPKDGLVISPERLIFTPNDWAAKTVTVKAFDDNEIDGALHSATIKHVVTTGDGIYNSNTRIPDVNMTIVDNDWAGVSIIQHNSSVKVTEDGAGDTYAIVLTSEPADDVNISISTSDNQISVLPTKLVFTNSNWNTPQEVTVTANDNFIIDGNRVTTIKHTASSNDPNYNNVAIPDISVNITDNDKAGIVITQTDGLTTVKEGSAGETYKIRLLSEPKSLVTVTFLYPDDQITVAPKELVFRSDNWNTPQTVTVSAIDDTRIEGEHSAIVSHLASSADNDYNGISTEALIKIIDNDSPPMPISANAGPDVTIKAGEATKLDGTSSSGTGLVYLWEKISGSGTLSHETTANPIYTSKGDEDGDVVIILTVTDKELKEAKDAVVIHVTKKDEPILPPVTTMITANSGKYVSLNAGESVTLNGGASTGLNLSYNWQIINGGGTLTNENTVTPTYISPQDMGNVDVVVILTVKNDKDDEAKDPLIIHVMSDKGTGGQTITVPESGTGSDTPVTQNTNNTEGNTTPAQAGGGCSLIILSRD